jgi:hypothetical protein
MKPWTPSFDPMTDTLTSAPVWVRLPNLPLHFWGLPSLQAIGKALGRFYYRSPETKNHNISTYARICVEMDFNKGFSTEIILTSENYSWTQKLDYEKVSLRCRACFETRHFAAQCPKGPRKVRKHQHKSTLVGWL